LATAYLRNRQPEFNHQSGYENNGLWTLVKCLNQMGLPLRSLTERDRGVESMSADTNVLWVFASWAGNRIEIKAGDGRFRFWRRFDLHHCGEVVALRKHGIGEQAVAGFSERQRGRRSAITRGYRDDLVGGSYGFSVCADKGDLHLAFSGDEELGGWLALGEHAAAIRAGDDGFVSGGEVCTQGECGNGEEAEELGFHSMRMRRDRLLGWLDRDGNGVKKGMVYCAAAAPRESACSAARRPKV
jgi:hypothetical protein